MQIATDEDGKPIVKCECGFPIYKKGVLRMRVALINKGYMCIKCPKCKRFEDSISLEIFMK